MSTKLTQPMQESPTQNPAQLGLNFQSAFSILFDLIHIFWGLATAFLQPILRYFFPTPLKDLDHEIILVTGAGNGMGKEMCLYLGETSPNSVLVLWDINKRDNDSVVEELRSRGVPAYGYQVDISDREKIQAAAEQVRHEVGNVSIIINNAGIMPVSKYFWEMSPALMEKCYQINVLSHYWILGEFLPNMMEKDHGHIVAMSSMAGLVPNECSAVYCGSKHAVKGFMDSIRMEFRSKKININLSTVYPAMVNTNLLGQVELISKYPSPIGKIEPREAAVRIVDGFRKNLEHIYVPDERVWYLSLIKNALPQRAVSAIDDVLNYHLEVKKTGVVEEEAGNFIVLGNGHAGRGTADQVLQPEEEEQDAPENKEVEIDNVFQNHENRVELLQEQVPLVQRNKKQARKGNA